MKLVKARIKCEDSAVSANGICLLDALMHSSCGEQLRMRMVHKVLARITKMADCKSKYPAPVQARSNQARKQYLFSPLPCFRVSAHSLLSVSRSPEFDDHPRVSMQVLRDWARCFATCGDIVAAASTLAPSEAGAGRQGSGRSPAQGQAQGQGGSVVDHDDHIDVPAARPRPNSSNPPAVNPAVTGVLTDGAPAAARLHRPPAGQSRSYQSALRSADKAAREEAAQRSHALAASGGGQAQGAARPSPGGEAARRRPPTADLSLEACGEVAELLARCPSSPAFTSSFRACALA